jgi:uncharacterized coiled-coil DUF342 family protein
MPPLLTFALDVALILLLIAGIFYAIRLLQQLTGLRQSRAEMERFIVEFSATVGRAEAGIRGLKQAARSGGDDLEKLIERASQLRDELTYLVESADQAASRLTDAAAKTVKERAKTDEPVLNRSDEKPRPERREAAPKAEKTEATQKTQKSETPPSSAPSSGAERELLRALGKLR